jgi:tripeptidyl-peptidase-1
MQLLTLSLLCVTALRAAAAPTSTYVLHERRDTAPRHWEKRGRVDPAIVLPMRIGLTQSNLDLGPGMLDEV